MINRIFVGLVILFFSSCQTLNKNLSFEQLMEQRSQVAKSLEKNPTYKNCNLNSHEQRGALRLNNNLWGKSRLKKQSALLCTYQKGEYYGWKWQVPNQARGVIGYPAIQYGASPWYVKEKKQGFPIPLEDIERLSISYDVEQYVKHRKYNLAFDLWLSSELKSNKTTITTEIMIWEDWFDFNSYGDKVEVLQTPFGKYQVYEGFLDKKEFNQHWQYFAFVRQNKRQKGEVDIQYLLEYLKTKFNVDPKNYLTSIEFGNEIGNSSGFTLIKEFKVDLN